MQDYVSEKSGNLAVKVVMKVEQLSERALKAAFKQFLTAKKTGRSTSKTSPQTTHGKQSVKEIIGQNQGVSNIEITDKNIKSFESVARKYGVDFAVKKVRGETPPKYLVFFKARDADALTAAFKEYSAKKVRQKRPSVVAQLRKMVSLVKDKAAERVKNKTKEQAR
jgi:hypothetical protein